MIITIEDRVSSIAKEFLEVQNYCRDHKLGIDNYICDMISSSFFEGNLFEIFEAITDYPHQYLIDNTWNDENLIEDVLFDLNYTFIICFSCRDVKNSLVQSKSIHLIKSMLSKTKIANKEVSNVNRILQKLKELNSWEDTSSLEFDVSKVNKLELSHELINGSIIKFISELFDNVNLSKLSSDMSVSLKTIEDMFTVLISLLRTIENINVEPEYIREDPNIGSILSALDNIMYLDFNQRDSCFIPFANVLRLDSFYFGNRKEIDLNKKFNSEFVILDFLIWYCWDNNDVLLRILQNVKNDELYNELMFCVMNNGVFGYKKRKNIQQDQHLFLTGWWMKSLEDLR